jgi:kynurenine formamidase
VIRRLEEIAARCNNWGKWGADDERGTLNYITPEAIIAAARLVRRGAVFSLAIPFDGKGPQPGGHPRRFNPIHRMMLTGSDYVAGGVSLPGGVGFSDDMIMMPTHCATQWDALSHCFVDGRMYNGFSAADVTSAGARRNSIIKIARGVVARGVLVDLPRFKRASWLEPGYPITVADLEGALGAQKVDVSVGDALIVRTGHIALCRSRGSWGDYAGGDAPGMSLETADWVHARQIAALATDTWGMEVRPNEVSDTIHPMHQILLTQMGLLVGEIFDLEELAVDCDRDAVYEFLFVAPPLPITGAVGSPINPLAIK